MLRAKCRVATVATVSVAALLGAFGSVPNVAGAAVAAAAKPGVCSLLTTEQLGTALASTVQPGSSEAIGIGRTCGYEAVGPVRGATVRLARGRQAKVAMATTLRALREVLRSVDSEPPHRVAGLGDRAYYSLDEFLGEGSIEVLDGRTFVQVTAIVSPGTDTAAVSEAVLSGLARDALAAATGPAT